MEITITTLKIMSPHVKRFDDVDGLLVHLATIGYLDVDGTAYKAEPDVTMTTIDYPPHDGVAYILCQTTPGGQRAHRVDFPGVPVGAVTFEHELNAAGVTLAGM